MERFCHNCGSLVSGEGTFCPQCGGALDGVPGINNTTDNTAPAVDLTKPADSVPAAEMPAASAAPVQTATPVQTAAPMNAGYTYGSNTYTEGHTAPYVNPTNSMVQPEEMTTGQWVLTLFLSSLGIIGIILLFVWGFSETTPVSKKNFSRAMLIWYAIAMGICIVFTIISFACAATLPFMFMES